jgi:hypothetical protein
MDLLTANPAILLTATDVNLFLTMALYTEGNKDAAFDTLVKLAMSLDLKGTPFAS